MERLRSEGCKKSGCMLASKPTCKETRSANFFQKFGRSFPVPYFLYSTGRSSTTAETPPSPAPPPPSFSQPPPSSKKILQMLPLPCHMIHDLIFLQKTGPHHTIRPKFVPYMIHCLFHLFHLPRLFRFKQV